MTWFASRLKGILGLMNCVEFADVKVVNGAVCDFNVASSTKYTCHLDLSKNVWRAFREQVTFEFVKMFNAGASRRCTAMLEEAL